MDHFQLFINGEFVDAADGKTFFSIDHGTGEPIATVAQAGEGEVNAAIESARRAFDSGGIINRTKTEVFLGSLMVRNLAHYAANHFPWREDIPVSGNPFFTGRNYICRGPLGFAAAKNYKGPKGGKYENIGLHFKCDGG